jgi:hypothetical protein
MVRLISMAMTGYFRTVMRPRQHRPLSMLKYDPIGTETPDPLDSHVCVHSTFDSKLVIIEKEDAVLNIRLTSKWRE